MALLVMPTMHFVLGEEPAPKSASSKREPPAKGKSPMVYGGVVATTSIVNFDSSKILYIPVYVYGQLALEETRRDLKITAEQERKLRDLSQGYRKQTEEAAKQFTKEIAATPPEQRDAVCRKFNTTAKEWAMAARPKIEAILTREQLKSLRSLAVGLHQALILREPVTQPAPGTPVTGKLKADLADLGLSGPQTEELALLARKSRRNSAINVEATQAMEKRMLDVITPQQRRQLEQAIHSGGFSGITYPASELIELFRDETRQRLGLTDEQLAKIQDVLNRSQAIFSVDEPWSTTVAGDEKAAKGHSKKQAPTDDKIAEASKADHDRIKAILTEKQLAELEKLIARRELSQSVMAACHGGSSLSAEDRKKIGVLGLIDISDKQWEMLGQACEERERTTLRVVRESGEGILGVLSPQQQDKLIDVLERFTHGDYNVVGLGSPLPEGTEKAGDGGKADNRK